MLKEEGTLGLPLRSMKLHNNPLALRDQDKAGRDFESSYSSACKERHGLIHSQNSAGAASPWEHSPRGLISPPPRRASRVTSLDVEPVLAREQ
jgi:hypothetical protein